jgi:hypothetical protein
MNWERGTMRLARSLLAIAVCLALVGLSGCGRGRASVTGKVTFNNQPLTAGTISFVASPNFMGTGTINPDGTYTVADAPVGDVIVTVQTPPAPLGPVDKMMKPPPGVKGMPEDMKPEGARAPTPVKIVPAPTKYNSTETSPLHFTVEKGTQTYNIPLTP